MTLLKGVIMSLASSRRVNRNLPARGTPEFLHMAMRGAVQGVTRVVISGFNADIDTASVPEDIWGGDGLIPTPSGNESWEILGGVNDTAAGTGARTVSLTTVDANYVSTTQTITMNGATAVAIPGNCRFINSATVLTAGSLGKPSQALEIRVAPAGAARAYVSTEGVLNQAKFTADATSRLEMHSALIGVRTDGVTQQSVVFNNVVTNQAGRQLAPLRVPIFLAGHNPYRHEVANGLVPFVVIQPRNEATQRVTISTANNTQIDISILAFLYDVNIWP